MSKTNLHVESVPIDSLKPHPQNPRRGDVGLISESLKFHGQYKPLVCQRGTRVILAGNHTWQAAVALEWTHIQVVFVDVDDEAALRILLMDNRAADAADYNDPLLADVLKALHDSTGDLSGTGYDTDALDELLAAADGGTNFADGDGEDDGMPFERMAFSLTAQQVAKVKKALASVRDGDEDDDEANAAALVKLCTLAMKAQR